MVTGEADFIPPSHVVNVEVGAVPQAIRGMAVMALTIRVQATTALAAAVVVAVRPEEVA